jgi:hypothetical protein
MICSNVTKTAALLAFAALAFASPASAQASGDRAKEAMNACRDDYQRFCSDVTPGGGRILACLRTNANELGAACSQALRK